LEKQPCKSLTKSAVPVISTACYGKAADGQGELIQDEMLWQSK
jgi:hypothetical protein